MPKKFIAGNWKMYMTGAAAEALAATIAGSYGNENRVRVAVCPPFPYLSRVNHVLRDTMIALGAQNVYPQTEGAFTGEVSPAMLTDCGCQYVIVGHSERRKIFGESDEFINRKVHAALEAGLQVILCVGETLEERESKRTQAVLNTQITACLAGISSAFLAKMVVAYEPVWAIGTGRNATPEQAQEAHAFLRGRIGELCGKPAAKGLIIQYGGSVKPDNAKSILFQPDVDGALVGGASLKADQFSAIIRAAIELDS
jgi:triosephosphate isomerase